MLDCENWGDRNNTLRRKKKMGMKCIFIFSNILSDGVVSKLLVYERRLEFTIVKKLLSVVIAEPIVSISSANKTEFYLPERERKERRYRGKGGITSCLSFIADTDITNGSILAKTTLKSVGLL